MVVVGLTLRWLLAVILFSAAVPKLGHSRQVATNIERYGVLPHDLLKVAGRSLPILELTLAVALASGLELSAASYVAALFFLIMGGLIAWNLANGRQFDCGCGFAGESTIRWSLVARNAILAMVAIFVANAPVGFSLSASATASRHTEFSTTNLLPIPMTIILLAAAIRIIRPLIGEFRAARAERPTPSRDLARAAELA